MPLVSQGIRRTGLANVCPFFSPPKETGSPARRADLPSGWHAPPKSLPWEPMRVALAQLNPVVGDVPNNADKVKEFIVAATRQGAELVVFSELSLTGYPPRDLLEDPGLVADNVAALESVATCCHNIGALVGFARPVTEGPGPELEDAAALLVDGQIREVFTKSLLPNYSVYDDPRYFRPGRGPSCFELGGHVFGVTICEDLWDSVALGRDLYGLDPIGLLADKGVDILVNISASGFQCGKIGQREELISRQARRCKATLLYVNQVGGNDEMIFDGGSCAVSPSGELLARAASFREDLLLVDTETGSGHCEPLADDMGRLTEALQLGLRDYVRKGGFDGVVVSLAEDAASAVVATLGVDALGAGQVRALAMCGPQEQKTLADIRQLADDLGITPEAVSIEAAGEAMEAALRATGGRNDAVRTARMGDRLCGLLLSACAEAEGRLALAPVDKTDLALGRYTLADSMPGALAPIGDVLRQDVIRLGEHLSGSRGRIPRAMLTAPRSGGGSEGSATEPDGPVVDGILAKYIEQGRTIGQIVGDGFDREVVTRTVRQVDRGEYRRKQAPPVLMVTSRAFGGGRRLPVARRYD